MGRDYRLQSWKSDGETTTMTFADGRTERLEDALDRLAECEATIERVREAVDAGRKEFGDVARIRLLDAALDPRPPFNLPTKAGVRFEATGMDDQVIQFESVKAFSHVYYMAKDRLAWTADEVMALFHSHRLIMDDGA